MRLPKGVRDGLVLAAVLAVLLASLALYARVWPPAVVVESSSMMHRDGPFGRVGTIDPGDLVVVKAVDGVDDVATLVEGGRSRYGLPGDVLIYFPADDRAAVPIIHRAIAYVEVEASGYRVRWDPDAPCVGGASKDGAWCRYGSAGVTIPAANLDRYRPNANGFVTKGDNPVTNPDADVVNRISHDAEGHPSIVRPEWVEGKARGEVPWLGLLKLSLAGQPNERNPPASYVRVGWAYAPPDLWVMLGVALAVLVGGPLAFDAWRARRRA